MRRLHALFRNPYALIVQGFVFGGVILIATQDSREAVAAPAPSEARR